MKTSPGVWNKGPILTCHSKLKQPATYVLSGRFSTNSGRELSHATWASKQNTDNSWVSTHTVWSGLAVSKWLHHQSTVWENKQLEDWCHSTLHCASKTEISHFIVCAQKLISNGRKSQCLLKQCMQVQFEVLVLYMNTTFLYTFISLLENSYFLINNI